MTATPPPDEPTDGRSCDGGHCNKSSIGWRFYPIGSHGYDPEWLPVCRDHMEIKGVPARYRHYDPPETR